MRTVLRPLKARVIPTGFFPFVLLVVGCAQTGPRALAPPPEHAVSLAVHWLRDSAEYRASTRQVYAGATTVVDAEAKKLAPHRWGVILDVDETILDNSDFQRERERTGTPVSEDAWSRWVRERRAKAVPGAPAFLAHVRSLGGVVALVTNRAQSQCEDSKRNLEAVGLVYDLILCRADGERGDKNPRFRAIQEGAATPGIGPLRIVAWVGDNIGDFPGLSQDLRAADDSRLDDFGRRYFVVPNPMYGSWVGNPER